MNEGFISIHRKIEENRILKGSLFKLGIWNHLLLNATHQTYKTKQYGFTIERGQLITSKRIIGAKYNEAPSKVYRFLTQLVKAKMITMETITTKLGTISLVTICKYDTFQTQNGITESKSPNNQYKNIIDYLNEKIGTNYKHTTDETKRLINARYNDGFTYDDFIKAIDNAHNHWKDQFNGLKNMKPKTLFNGSFEGRSNGTAYNWENTDTPSPKKRIIKNEFIDNRE
jgi:uncharacterized phage protein (TIGR02220 family)